MSKVSIDPNPAKGQISVVVQVYNGTEQVGTVLVDDHIKANTPEEIRRGTALILEEISGRLPALLNYTARRYGAERSNKT